MIDTHCGGAGLSIEYLEKASETPATGAEEIREIVADMMADIEFEGHSFRELLHGRTAAPKIVLRP